MKWENINTKNINIRPMTTCSSVKSFVLSKCFILVLLVAFSMNCKKTEDKETKAESSCTCDLSDLEILQNDSICWSRAGTTEGFVHWSERIFKDTLRDVKLLQSQLDRLGEAGGGTLIVPEGNFIINEIVRIPSNVSLVKIV